LRGCFSLKHCAQNAPATRPAAATAPPRHHAQRRHHEPAVPLRRHARRRLRRRPVYTPATSYSDDNGAAPVSCTTASVPRSRPATRSTGATPWREATRRGTTPLRAARRGLATSYTMTSTVPPGIMHDGAPRSRPAARSVAWREAALGFGPHRGWRTSARRGATACVGQFGRGATWRTFLRLSPEG
jgi:hypothetical protein